LDIIDYLLINLFLTLTFRFVALIVVDGPAAPEVPDIPEYPDSDIDLERLLIERVICVSR